ncbi:putative ribonuclease H2 non-catalytic subunit (Ylr154p-like) [Lyophyllum shimeji]|uniref:Ribonuclease H2 non-catalytic subunit (Ylr154p-like) n=1 Tax=Lyophyllum shimeji TaxID=47721 RepID=A0A9P3UQB8_LYOSH|nr:putative ribonuclease H2 non-catalytic subunit (Ylr154p-like) [Lyophyllum shimeji]
MAAAPTVVLAPIADRGRLKSCTPYLMPFHIDYTGPAPISTYLRVQPANETVGAPPRPEGAAQEDSTPAATNDAGPSKTHEGPVAAKTADHMGMDASSTSVPPAPSSPPPPRPSPSLAKRVTDATTRFISAFRGRTIQGLKVPLPEGYVGVVLRGDGTANAGGQSRGTKGTRKGKATATARGRVTRSKTRTPDDEDRGEEDSMDVDHGNGVHHALLDEEAVRTLTVSSQFSSFVLWHADHPVDEHRDDYVRALTEWTRLADVIHRVED